MKKPIKKTIVKKPRLDLTITKECDNCGVEYHSRKNGYEMISRFCSVDCTKKGKSRPNLGRSCKQISH